MKDLAVLTDQDVKGLFRSATICPVIVMRSKIGCRGVRVQNGCASIVNAKVIPGQVLSRVIAKRLRNVSAMIRATPVTTQPPAADRYVGRSW